MLIDSTNKLNDTKYTQPVLCTINEMYYHKLLEETGKKPDFLIGNSLGEYNALCAAGVISFEDGLRLVKARGKLMSKVNGGSMAAVIGLSADRIEEV